MTLEFFTTLQPKDRHLTDIKFVVSSFSRNCTLPEPSENCYLTTGAYVMPSTHISPDKSTMDKLADLLISGNDTAFFKAFDDEAKRRENARSAHAIIDDGRSTCTGIPHAGPSAKDGAEDELFPDEKKLLHELQETINSFG